MNSNNAFRKLDNLKKINAVGRVAVLFPIVVFVSIIVLRPKPSEESGYIYFFIASLIVCLIGSLLASIFQLMRSGLIIGDEQRRKFKKLCICQLVSGIVMGISTIAIIVYLLFYCGGWIGSAPAICHVLSELVLPLLTITPVAFFVFIICSNLTRKIIKSNIT